MNNSVLYNNILESMVDGVITFDSSGKIITFNNAASKILGIKLEDTVGRLNSELFFNYKENDNFNDVLITAIREKKSNFYKEVTFRKNDKKIISLGVTSSLYKNEDGKVTGSVLVITDLSERERSQFLEKTLNRYINKEVVDLILEKPDEIILDGEEKNVTILFSDIRGFSLMSENMEPKDIVSILSDYFEGMVSIVFDYNGTLDKFIGDAMMCVFGTPVSNLNHAEMAVLSGLAMLKELASFNKRQNAAGLPELKIGIGINSGKVIAGNIGSKKRLEYTVIGDSVNIASRLESSNKKYGTSLIISESTYLQVKNKILAREIGIATLKGKIKPVKIFEVINTIKDSTDQEKEVVRRYSEGLSLYKKNEFITSKKKFNDILKILPEDSLAAFYIEKCGVKS